jgi:hypothetical protein
MDCWHIFVVLRGGSSAVKFVAGGSFDAVAKLVKMIEGGSEVSNVAWVKLSERFITYENAYWLNRIGTLYNHPKADRPEVWMRDCLSRVFANEWHISPSFSAA